MIILSYLEGDRTNCKPEENSIVQSRTLRAVLIVCIIPKMFVSFVYFSPSSTTLCFHNISLQNDVTLFSCKSYHYYSVIFSTIKGILFWYLLFSVDCLLFLVSFKLLLFWYCIPRPTGLKDLPNLLLLELEDLADFLRSLVLMCFLTT